MPKSRLRNRQLLPDDLDDFETRLHNDSDRGAVLVAAALLDAQLEDLLRSRLRHHQDKLLGLDGPLATFANRIRFARAMELIEVAVESDLNIIRNIRNKFAHSFDQDLSFSDPEVAGWCSSLQTVGAYLTAFDQAKDRLHQTFSLELIAAWRAIVEPPRIRYLTTTFFVAQHLKEVAQSTGNCPSLIDEVTKLGLEFNIRISASGSVAGSAVADKSTDA